MKNYAYSMDENEKKLLTEILNCTQELLSTLIEKEIIDPAINQELINAWHDMSSHFEEIRVQLAIIDQLALSFQGLTGGQLELKLALGKHLMTDYHDAMAKNGFDYRTKQQLKHLLIALDILIYDLIQATHSGGAVSSFLKCLLALLA